MTDTAKLLAHLARGVHALSCHDGSGSMVPPYPGETQYALDSIVLECLFAGRTPPAGVPELIQWCTDLTSRRWPFSFGERHSAPPLVSPVHRTRTRACAELAGLAAVAAELMTELTSDASAAEAAARRRFVRSHAVVGPDTHRRLLMDDPDAATAYRFVKDLYRPPPAEWVFRGKIAVCECGLLALPDTPDERFTAWCERETCHPGKPVKHRLPVTRTLVLDPSLRLFVSLPAKAEERFHRDLATTALPGTGIPVVRFYDRVVPSALAHDAVSDRVDIAVVPDDSAMALPERREAFRAALPPEARIVISTESELLTNVAAGRKEF
ncbi:hypothetical protein [Amycolatopsis sp. cmx-11-12]|uniref:pPIWI_RE_Y domain-containing protein n=1 Tax=Amycolatopsis sp. cmx-11-12 TaxID=2785795 RepID=UPI003917E615